MSVTEVTWPQRLTVDKRIVKILSEATYENFPNALKEIIVNGYDADATIVDVRIDFENETLIVEDNGWGMNESDFAFYCRIAGTKREKENRTLSGRRIIGQFGVGFLSIFPFFKNYYIESTKSGTSEILNANIPCYLYFSPDRQANVSDISIQGGVKSDETKVAQSYTKIVLSGFTKICKAFFFPEYEIDRRRHSIQNYSSIEKLKWRLSEDLPLEYEDERFQHIFKDYSPNLPFKVKINNYELSRKAYGKTLLESNENEFFQIGNIKCRYFILTDKISIRPYEARYLKIRNLNVGVGGRETFGLGTEIGGARSRLHWLTGEIDIIDGVNDLITVSRNDFNYSPDYEQFKEFFVQRLSHHSYKLENEAEVKKFFSEMHGESRITNIKYLDVISERKTSNESAAKNELSALTKRITVNNKKYVVKSNKWDYEKELYPACKIENNELIINNSYPLFSGVKYTDVFVKMHLLLLINLNEGHIDRSTYSKLVNDILVVFADYL